MSGTLTIVLVVGLSWVFRGILFRTLFCYKMTEVRSLNKEFTQKQTVSGTSERVVEGSRSTQLLAIINEALEFTDEHLLFAVANTKTEPDELLTNGRAHCVGYAAFLKAAIENVIDSQHMRNIEVYHVVGKVYLLGVDLHRFFENCFLRDHDYNIVVDRSQEKIYFIDPSLHDIAGIGFVRGDSHDNWPNKSLQRTADSRR